LTMFYKQIIRFCIFGFLSVWFIVTFAAFFSMYSLWWNRERVEYLDSDIIEQRKIIFQKAGMPHSYLEALVKIKEKLPEFAHYTLKGQVVQGSYLTYLLIPRVPDGYKGNSLTLGDTVDIVTETVPAAREPSSSGVDASAGFKSIFFSFGLIIGLVFLLKLWKILSVFSMPELFAAVCLFVHSMVVLSKIFFQQAVPAFWLITALGVSGWVLAGKNSLQDRLNIRFKISVLQHKWLFTGAAIVLLSVLWSLLMAVVVVPDDWDAWAIWGSKAKMLVLGNGPLVDVSYFGHMDYPLLWPAVWAFSSWFAGGWEELWSKGWGAVFLFLCCWEIAVIIQRNTSRLDLGVFAGALFASIPLVPLIASWSYAEAPYWLISLSAFGCLLMWRTSRKNICLIWAALLCAAAAYTKNEGVLFFAAALLWVILEPGEKVRSTLLFAVIFLLLYSPWYYWVNIVNDFASHATTGLVLSSDSLLHAMDRLPKALGKIGIMYSDIKQWNLVLWGLGAVWIFSLWKPKTYIDLLMPVFILSGYLIIVIFHHADIYWQVGTSWNRLSLQILPLLIVVVVPRVWDQWKGIL